MNSFAKTSSLASIPASFYGGYLLDTRGLHAPLLVCSTTIAVFHGIFLLGSYTQSYSLAFFSSIIIESVYTISTNISTVWTTYWFKDKEISLAMGLTFCATQSAYGIFSLFNHIISDVDYVLAVACIVLVFFSFGLVAFDRWSCEKQYLLNNNDNNNINKKKKNKQTNKQINK